jgi:hypothetical protein
MIKKKIFSPKNRQKIGVFCSKALLNFAKKVDHNIGF